MNSESEFSRRDFLKIAGLGLGAMAFNPFKLPDLEYQAEGLQPKRQTNVRLGGTYQKEPAMSVIEEYRKGIGVVYSDRLSVGTDHDGLPIAGMANHTVLVQSGTPIQTYETGGKHPAQHFDLVQTTIQPDNNIYMLGVDPNDPKATKIAKEIFDDAMQNSPSGAINAEIQLYRDNTRPGTYHDYKTIEIRVKQNPKPVDGRLIAVPSKVVAKIGLVPMPVYNSKDPNITGQGYFPINPVLLTDRPNNSEIEIRMDINRPVSVNPDDLFSGKLAKEIRKTIKPFNIDNNPITVKLPPNGHPDFANITIAGKDGAIEPVFYGIMEGNKIGYDGDIRIIGISVLNPDRTSGLIMLGASSSDAPFTIKQIMTGVTSIRRNLGVEQLDILGLKKYGQDGIPAIVRAHVFTTFAPVAILPTSQILNTGKIPINSIFERILVIP